MQISSKLLFRTVVMMLGLLLAVSLFLVVVNANNQAGATSAGDMAKVKTYVAAYIANQYAADAVYGESGFVIDRAALKARIDSNGDMNTTSGAGVLGEGDDAAGNPVIIDNLNQTGVIPGTAVQCTWNTGLGTTNCFDATKVAAVKAKVDAHAAAGFSTDIVDYCVSGHTEAPTTGGWGYLAQTPNGLGTGITPKVYAFKWGRNGWIGTAQAAYSNANPLTATATPGSYTPPTTTPPTSCNSSVSDAELVRCQAQWAIYGTGTVNGATAGNVGNGINPTGTSPAQTLAASQIVDIRPGNPNSIYIAGKQTINDPINEIFTDAGLAKINSGLSGGTTGVIVAGRTQMTGGIVAMGLKMLGEPMGTNGFLQKGMPNWNNAQDEKQNTVALSPAYPVPGPSTTPAGDLHAVVDSVVPSITSPGVTNITTSSADVYRTTNEPATSKIALLGSDGHVVDANNTILNASKTVSLSGLHPGVTYTGTLTAYDGAANGSSTAISFTTETPVDSTPPSISSIVPSGNLVTTTADVAVYYSDSESGINTASVSVSLNGEDITSACTVTADYASCPRTGLGQGANAIAASVNDVAGNNATGVGGFFVDTKSPKASVSPRNITGGGYGSTSATITAYVFDVAPMWPVAANSGVNPATIAVTFDGAPVTGCSLTPATYADDEPLEFVTTNPVRVDVPAVFVSCPEVTGLSQGNHTIVVTEQDMFGNSGTNTRTFKVDTIAPSVTNLQPSGTIGTADTVLTADLSDGTGTGIKTTAVTVTLDGSPVSGCTITATSASCAVYGLADGAHSFTVSASDKTNNVGTGSGSFTVDTCTIGKPTLQLVAPNAFWASYADYVAHNLSVTWTVLNTGSTTASNVQLTSSNATYAPITTLTSMPATVGTGTLAPSFGGSVTVQYHLPIVGTGFRVVNTASATDCAGTGYTYP